MTKHRTISQVIKLAELGEAAGEWLHLDNKAKLAREEYQIARNDFLRKAESKERQRVRDFIGDPEFHLATDELYADYKDAKRRAYNARRRLETKYRNLNTGAAK